MIWGRFRVFGWQWFNSHWSYRADLSSFDFEDHQKAEAFIARQWQVLSKMHGPNGWFYIGMWYDEGKAGWQFEEGEQRYIQPAGIWSAGGQDQPPVPTSTPPGLLEQNPPAPSENKVPWYRDPVSIGLGAVAMYGITAALGGKTPERLVAAAVGGLGGYIVGKEIT